MRIGIVGYGKLGRAAECMAARLENYEVKGIFSRRAAAVDPDAKIYSIDDIINFKAEIDCLLICQGSSGDTPSVTPNLAVHFNTVDSYDRHGDIARHRSAVDGAARLGGNLSVVSVGWDPGLFSLFRIYTSAFMPYGVTNTFWGRGISQGHSEAICRIRGVSRAVQYTVPKAEALTLAESGVRLSDTERHRRVCYIVAEPGEEERISEEIKRMDGYFLGYDVEIHFINESEFLKEHRGAAHGGRIISIGRSGAYGENQARIELSLAVDSNPEFTAGVMLSSAAAALRMRKEGRLGAFTLSEIPPAYLLPLGRSELDYM